MTLERVPADKIEEIVGVSRDPVTHWGRAVSEEERVYILHSAECRASMEDLLECEYSRALGRGIDCGFPWTLWRHVQDQPVPLEIFDGYVLPALAVVKAAVRTAAAQRRAAEDLTFPLEMIWHDALPPAEVGSISRAGLGRLLEAAWDDGNGTGLDGWVGPGRGAGAIDPEAVQARTRTVNKLLEKYCPEEVTG